VILFPAIKRAGVPWVRIISCSENEIPDPDIPPHLSGCGENEKACFEAFERAFLKAIEPTHTRFNEFLATVEHPPYPPGQFFEASPWLNLLLYPEPLKFKRQRPLNAKRFQYLEGCVREEGGYQVPSFAKNQGGKLIYVSFGSLGANDLELYRRMIKAFGKSPHRYLMNVGDHKAKYEDVPGNVILESWFPQPAVVPQADLFIHHGGNNSFNEALYFGKPALIMPYCWDGLDNARRIEDTRLGARLPRYDWSESELIGTIDRLLSDGEMHRRLEDLGRHMRAADGRHKAARLLADVAEGRWT
jgi:MGT family glycosyltransferase